MTSSTARASPALAAHAPFSAAAPSSLRQRRKRKTAACADGDVRRRLPAVSVSLGAS